MKLFRTDDIPGRGGNIGIAGADLIFCAIAADVLSRDASAATVLTAGRSCSPSRAEDSRRSS